MGLLDVSLVILTTTAINSDNSEPLNCPDVLWHCDRFVVYDIINKVAIHV